MFKNVIVSFIIFVASFSAWATPQTYKVTAKISSVVENTPGTLPAPLSIGDEVAMTYVLDDAKSPDYQDNWNISYSFNQNDGSVQISWLNVTLKTLMNQSTIHHHIGLDANNGNGIQHYHVGGWGQFENNGNPAPDLQFIGLDLHSDGAHQVYTPWVTPDLNKFTMKQLHVGADGYWFDADVTSIVKDADQPFSVWPGDGNMHISQQFDVFVTAPEGYNYIEFVTDPMAPPLAIACEIAPNFNGQTEMKFLCRDLNAGRLQLYYANYVGVTIRLRNLATGKSLERVMNWRMVE